MPERNQMQNLKIQEEQNFNDQKKEIIKGRLKWYNIKRGYGFIEREDNKKDV